MRLANNPALVLDASAVLAYLQREPGYHRVEEALDNRPVISTVNLAELFGRLVGRQQMENAAATLLLRLQTYPFIEADARTSANLLAQTRPLGLSLGDRACLALGLRLGIPVLTADRAWALTDVGLEVRVLR